MTRDEIYEKLEQVADLKERMALKKILEGVFFELHEHSEAMYGQLQQRVFEELDYTEGRYNLYTSIIQREEYDPVNEFLFPMNENDLVPREYDIDALMQGILEESKMEVFKVFFQCDYLILEEIFKQNRVFKGTIKTNKKSYTAYFEMDKEESYRDQIKQVYETFIENQIPWHTVNAPYINKIVKIYLVKTEEKLSSQETIEEIVIDFAEYANYVKYDMVPLWNIEQLQVVGMGFAVPCEDKISYEHKVSLRGLGMENGYLVESQEEEIKGIRHTSEYLYIITPTEESISWSIKKIVKPIQSQVQGSYYPVMSNTKRINFLDKLSQRVTYPIKTKAEILRLFNTLEVTENIELSEISIVDKMAVQSFETYSLNPFIIDEIRDSEYTKILLLNFHEKGQTSWLTRDILSFIVSEIQHYYPEYRCEGRLL